MIQGSIAAANSSLVDIARSVNDVDIVKKKVTVDYDDFNRRIEEIETAIGANSKSNTSMYSAGGQKRLADGLLTNFGQISKFEVETCGKIDELESSKINTHAFETKEQIKSMNNKIPQNEKSINRLARGAA